MIKIARLCHFTNQAMIEYFQAPSVNEFAPWINNLLKLFMGNSNIELFIVAPHVSKNMSCNFEKKITFSALSIREVKDKLIILTSNFSSI